MLAERYVIPAGDSVGLAVVRALVLLKLTNLLFQIEIFMCTDVYALFALATRSRNLWATKGAVARRLLRRATPADRELLELLAASGSREVRWATVYLALDVPGIAWATWYLPSAGRCGESHGTPRGSGAPCSARHPPSRDVGGSTVSHPRLHVLLSRG